MQGFKNILEYFRSNFSDISWVSRRITFSKSYCSNHPKPTPDELKAKIYNNEELYRILEQLWEKNEKKQISKKLVVDILSEIGYNYDLYVIRILGYILVKLLRRSYSALYVNEEKLLKIKNEMGLAPVIFLPSHRSYCDFILMAFICFHYGINIPCVAAGIDFNSMKFMNEILRKCKAFYMRRKFSDDIIYRTVFQEYMKALITYEDSPIEFFIEGTRSRSGKSLMPKFGLLTMLLEAFLCGDISDVIVIPVNISYDRVLEEALFSYEHLGIPKPKETTKGLLKALANLNGNYGNVFINFGDPFSIRTYLDTEFHLRARNNDLEQTKIKEIAFKVIELQQNLQVYGCFNILAMILYNIIQDSKTNSISLLSAIDDFKWLLNIYNTFSGNIFFEGSIEDALTNAITVHSSLVELSDDKFIHFKIDKCSLGYKDNTCFADHPIIILQLYINPSLHLFIRSSIIIAILMKRANNNELAEDLLYKEYCYFCELVRYEFVLHETGNEKYIECISKLNELDIVEKNNGIIRLKQHNKTVNLLYYLIKPFLISTQLICSFLNENDIRSISFSEITKIIQTYIRERITSDVLQYCLSTDLIMNSLNSLCALGIIKHDINRKVVRNGILLNEASEFLCRFSTGYNHGFSISRLVKKEISSKL